MTPPPSPAKISAPILGALYGESLSGDYKIEAEGNLTTERGHIPTEAEIQVTQPQAKGCWQPPEAESSSGEILPSSLLKDQPCDTLMLALRDALRASRLQNYRKINVCLSV